jgi:hypothetical protein
MTNEEDLRASLRTLGIYIYISDLCSKFESRKITIALTNSSGGVVELEDSSWDLGPRLPHFTTQNQKLEKIVHLYRI